MDKKLPDEPAPMRDVGDPGSDEDKDVKTDKQKHAAWLDLSDDPEEVRRKQALAEEEDGLQTDESQGNDDRDLSQDPNASCFDSQPSGYENIRNTDEQSDPDELKPAGIRSITLKALNAAPHDVTLCGLDAQDHAVTTDDDAYDNVQERRAYLDELIRRINSVGTYLREIGNDLARAKRTALADAASASASAAANYDEKKPSHVADIPDDIPAPRAPHVLDYFEDKILPKLRQAPSAAAFCWHYQQYVTAREHCQHHAERLLKLECESAKAADTSLIFDMSWIRVRQTELLTRFVAVMPAATIRSMLDATIEFLGAAAAKPANPLQCQPDNDGDEPMYELGTSLEDDAEENDDREERTLSDALLNNVTAVKWLLEIVLHFRHATIETSEASIRVLNVILMLLETDGPFCLSPEHVYHKSSPETLERAVFRASRRVLTDAKAQEELSSAVRTQILREDAKTDKKDSRMSQDISADMDGQTIINCVLRSVPELQHDLATAGVTLHSPVMNYEIAQRKVEAHKNALHQMTSRDWLRECESSLRPFCKPFNVLYRGGGGGGGGGSWDLHALLMAASRDRLITVLELLEDLTEIVELLFDYIKYGLVKSNPDNTALILKRFEALLPHLQTPPLDMLSVNARPVPLHLTALLQPIESLQRELERRQQRESKEDEEKEAKSFAKEKLQMKVAGVDNRSHAHLDIKMQQRWVDRVMTAFVQKRADRADVSNVSHCDDVRFSAYTKVIQASQRQQRQLKREMDSRKRNGEVLTDDPDTTRPPLKRLKRLGDDGGGGGGGGGN